MCTYIICSSCSIVFGAGFYEEDISNLWTPLSSVYLWLSRTCLRGEGSHGNHNVYTLVSMVTSVDKQVYLRMS